MSKNDMVSIQRSKNKKLKNRTLRIKKQKIDKDDVSSKKLDKRSRIIDVALELLNKDNLNNLSLRKLASLLDIQAPALYWYFESKGVLIDYMAEAILKKEFCNLDVRDANESWQEWLQTVMNRLRKIMLEYTDGARVVAGAHLFPAKTLGKIFELSLRSLNEAGLDLIKARQIMITAITYTFGYTIEEQSSIPNIKIKTQRPLNDFPTLLASMEEANRRGISSYDDFNAGLQLIISKN